MPLRLVRYQQSQQSHFVTFSCYRCLALLKAPAMRNLVVAALEQTRRRFSFRVYGFVVMPEHVHLLVSEPERALLANAIQSLKIAVAKRSAVAREFVEIESEWAARKRERAAGRLGPAIKLPC